jgi:hypothetical protein
MDRQMRLTVTKKIATVAAVLVLAGLVTSCNCSSPLEIASIQKGDKKLACKDIILEINEAEHYRGEAQDSKRIGLGNMLMPTCWISGYINGEQAIKSADARIDYLGHIYDLLDCGGMAGPGAGDEDALPALDKPIRRVQPKALPMPPLPGASSEEGAIPRNPARVPGSGSMQKDEQGIIYRPLALPERK